MVRPPCYDSNGMKKGAWSEDEDNKLRAYIMRYGHWNWRLLPKYAGLARCGKSCRLRWVNYLKPGVKRGNFTKHEKDLIVELHSQLGNKWSAIAAKLPGRTDNDIKNYWNAHIDKRGKHANKVIGHTINEASNQEHSDIALWETYVNELASFDALPKLEDPMLPFDTKFLDSIAKPQVNSYPDTNQTDYIPTLFEDVFFWSEPIVSYAPNLPSENSYKVWPENDGGLYDPCLPYFDHGMVLL